MRLKISILIFIIVFPGILLAESNLTVDQAIDYALKNNEEYLKVIKETERANQRVVEAQSSALPQFNASLDYTRNWELPSTAISMNGELMTLKMGSVNNYSGALTITQPIYVGGKVFTALSIARKYRKLAIQQQIRAARELKLNVIKAFYGTVMADEMFKVTAESESLASKGLDVVNNLYAQGLVSDYEVLRSKVRLANSKPTTLQAQSQSLLAHKSLNSLIGIPLEDKFQLIYDMDSSRYIMPPLNLDSAKAAAMENRPEVNMMSLQTEMYKKAVSIAWGGWRPSIFFFSSLQYQAQSNRAKFPKSADFLRSSMSGIQISIPLFDSWKTVAQVKQAKIDLVQSKLSEQELADNIKLDVENSWWNYKRARESLASGGQAVEMARRGLDIARVRYENGVGTQLEMFDAEVALTAAETNKIQAFYDLVTGYASLKKALGEEELLK